MLSYILLLKVLYERGKVSERVQSLLNHQLSSCLKDSLRTGAEFWDASKTLRCLCDGDYFVDEEMAAAGVQWPDPLRNMISDSELICNISRLASFLLLTCKFNFLISEYMQ